jgi:hypothetical protein
MRIVTIQDVLNSHAYETVILYCGKCMEMASGYMTAIMPTVTWQQYCPLLQEMTLNFEGVGHEGFINSLFFSPYLLI